MITRRRMVIAFASIVLAVPLAVPAQPQGKVRRIGFLGAETAAGYAKELEALRDGLKDFGYIEDMNVVILYRWAEGARDRLPQLAAELLREKVDVLVTHGQGVRAAQRATTTVPIVITGLGFDPVAAGLVKSLARPGGNLTGVLSFGAISAVKQLELVKDSLPSARKVAFMVLSRATGGEAVKRMEAAARTIKLDLQLVRVDSGNDLEAAIAGMAERRVDAIIVSNSPLFTANLARIAALAARQRIPAMGTVRFADSGGLMGYGVNTLTNWRRAAYFVERIFKGAKPAELPIEQPSAIELVINTKTARALGVRIPETVMVRADRIIE